MSLFTPGPQDDDLLTDLNPAQREAVGWPGGPLLILAGAGSGKTRVLTRRAAWLMRHGVNPYHILCITFTNKAAREMLDRLERLVGPACREMWVSTFHAACARILRREAEQVGLSRNFTILDGDDQRALIKECLKELNVNDKKFPPGAVLASIGRAKDVLMGPEAYQKRAHDAYTLQVAELYKLYQKRLHENNAVDFDDLIGLVVQLLEGVPAVREYYQQRFDHVLVDEYQDTNNVQYRLVKILAARHRNLTVVGDADQSIYSFRGADYTNILNFAEDYPDARVVKLEENYRSTQAILDIASQVIAKNRHRPERNLVATRGGGEAVEVFLAQDEQGEAQYVAGEIQRLRGSRPWSDFAVLYRTHAQSRVLEDAFMKRAIPYRVVGGQKFYERKEVKDMLAYLRLTANPRDRLSFQRIVNAPRRGIGPTTLARLEAYSVAHGLDLEDALARAGEIPGLQAAQAKQLVAFRAMMADFRQQAEFLSVFELMQEIMERSGYKAELLREQDIESLARLENLEELLSVAREFEAAGGVASVPEAEGLTGLEAFLQSVALVADVDTYDENQASVTMMTLHSAKGLEFPIVFLMGLEEGVFPHVRSLEEEGQVEEERRLCYVGMTRAEDHLFLTLARQRTLFGLTRENPPSRFLGEFDPSLARMSGWLGPVEPTPGATDGASATGIRQAVGGGVGGAGTYGAAGGARPPGVRRGGGPGYPGGPGGPDTGGGPPAGGLAGVTLQPGERVRHRAWGEGTVVACRGVGEDIEITIAFPDRGVRTVIARYAPLERC